MSGGGNIALFRTVPWLALSPCLGQNTPSTELFSQKNQVLLPNFFSSSNMLFIRLFLAITCREMLSWIRRSRSGWRTGAVRTGTRHKMALMLCAEKVAHCKTSFVSVKFDLFGIERHTHLACFQRHFSTFNKLNQPHNKEQGIKSGRQNSTSSSILMSKSNVPSFMKTFAPYFKMVVGPLFKGLSLHKKRLLGIKMKIQELFHKGSHLSNGQLPRKYTTH